MQLDTDASTCLNSRLQMSPDVFISYSREDQQQVVKLVDYLRGQGLNIWMDETDIHGATIWTKEIVEAIRAAAWPSARRVVDALHSAGRATPEDSLTSTSLAQTSLGRFTPSFSALTLYFCSRSPGIRMC